MKHLHIWDLMANSDVCLEMLGLDDEYSQNLIHISIYVKTLHVYYINNMKVVQIYASTHLLLTNVFIQHMNNSSLRSRLSTQW